MEFNEALDHLDALINHEVVPRAGAIEGLSFAPTAALMAAIGNPEGAYPVIHVTGTNGKGSTVRMVETLLTVMGLRVGAYTSPHLESVTERIRVGAESIPDDDFGMVIGDIARTAEANQMGLTWFETVTGAALLHFANEAVDVAIVEVGMLGRYDATNVVDARIAVVTNVGFDHTSGESDWRATGAKEKAGIITADSVLVLGAADQAIVPIFVNEGPARTVLRGEDFEVVEDRLAVGGRLISLRTPRGGADDVLLTLHGAHQAENASLALAVAEEFFGAPLPDDVITEAFDKVEMPGRLEIVHRSPLVVLDTAHNVPGAEALAETMATDFGEGRRRFLVLGMQDGRDPVAVCHALKVADYHLVVACTAPTARGLHADVVREAAIKAGANADAVHDVEAAIDHALGQADDHDLIVVAGSNTIVGKIRSIADEF
ncbi:MAG: bifunctional folylpolyglutamate synthase/dihydrofolate synthase [Acidimicrobiaceae bacterium]|nr:bifunctional folylpolyglutamate synthase/dihydrofolate synthase [Acidimicrobiaceae bacterium]